MELYLQITIWALQPQLWIIIGMVFILLEMMDGSVVFFLPVGVSALIMALWIYLSKVGVLPYSWLPEEWYWLLPYWISISLLTTLLISTRLKHKIAKDASSKNDINNY